MTNDALLVLQAIFGTVWRLFTSWHIPGTNVTPAVAFTFLIVAGIGLRFISRLFGVGVDVSAGYNSAISISDRIAASKGNPRIKE